MLDRETILIGYSGHGYVVAEAAILSGYNLRYYAELNESERNPFQLAYLGFEGNSEFRGWDMNLSFVLGIGDNRLRAKVAGMIEERGHFVSSVIHPNSNVADYSSIGKGSFIARNVAVNPLATIGTHCILNTSCTVEHECKLGDFVHIAPGAVLAGNVSVGDNSFIGANAVVKQGVTIGKNVVVGAGSVVLYDISDTCVVVGNPGRQL